MKTKPTKNQLIDMYVNQKLSKSQIAKIFNISPTTVLKHMKIYEIPRRSTSEALSGILKSESHKQKLSESKKGSKHPNYGKKCEIHGKRNWFLCPNGKTVSMRSSWETSFANYLNENNIDWQYEPKTFLLENGSAYTPDFYLTKTKEWVEVKGWFREEHKLKIEHWKNSNPKEKLVLADKKYLIELGIDLKKMWITSKPKFNCLQCNNEFYRNYPDQKLCCITCRNKFVANNKPLPKEFKIKRKYNGDQSGQNNSSSKLTIEDIEDIKRMRKENVPVTEIAKQKNSSPSNIYNICRGSSWKKTL